MNKKFKILLQTQSVRSTSMCLYTLVYVSVADDNFTDDHLLEILQYARKFNTSQGVTGMLLFRDGFFIQALEGDKAVVDKLFESISKDKRHFNVLKIYTAPINQRYFGDWAMGFESPNMDELKQIEGYSDFMQNYVRYDGLERFAERFKNNVMDLLDNFRR